MCVCVCVCVCVLYPNFGNFLYADHEHLHIWKFEVPLVLAHQLSSLTSNSMPPLVNNNFYSSQNWGFLGSF
jgi:hypothetical protein